MIDRLFGDVTHERKRLQTLRVVVRFAVQTVGVLLDYFCDIGNSRRRCQPSSVSRAPVSRSC